MRRLADTPAFPRPHSWDESPVKGIHEGDRPEPHGSQAGMTFRQYAAVAAMQGALASAVITTPEHAAEFAVACADALIRGLSE